MLLCGGDRGSIEIGLCLKGRRISRVNANEQGPLTSNVAEFPVLEDQEVLPFGYLLETFDCTVGEVIYNVGMRLKHAYRVAHFFR